MAEITIKSTTLRMDVEHILDDVKGGTPNIMQFCRDHHDPFLHHDKKPVFNFTQDELLGIYNSSRHFFLRAEQVARFAGYMKLRLPNMLALILKAEWEYFRYEIHNNQENLNMNVEVILKEKDLAGELASGFQPDVAEIYGILQATQVDGDEKISYGLVDIIIGEMKESMNFLEDNCSIDNMYPVNALTERVMLAKVSDQDREVYFHLKDRWIIRSDELDEYLHQLERKKQLNLNVEEEYKRSFAYNVRTKLELQFDEKKYSLALELKHKYPELSIRELVKSADEMMANQKQKLTELRQKLLSFSCFIDLPGADVSGCSGASDGFRNDYEQKCKALTRKIFKLLHSDRLRHNKNYSGEKKKEINDLWMEIMDATSDEKIYSFSPAMMLYDLPDYDHLLKIYIRACRLMGVDPEDFEIGDRLEFMISNGRSFGEVIEFLEGEIERLDYQLANLELRQMEYTGQDNILEHKAALSDPDKHNEDLEAEISDLKERIKNTRKLIVNEFKLKRHARK